MAITHRSVLNSSVQRADSNANSRVTATSLLLLSSVLLGACSSTPKPVNCNEATPAAYQKAKDQAALKIPDGMETPDRRNALAVPPPNGTSKLNLTCLERAPPYFGTASRIAASPEEVVADWAQAWSERNTDAVMAMYAKNFSADPEDAAVWLERRRNEVATAPAPLGRIEQLKVANVANDQRSATFVQKFGSSAVMKEVRLTREGGVWKIVQERVISGQ